MLRTSVCAVCILAFVLPDHLLEMTSSTSITANTIPLLVTAEEQSNDTISTNFDKCQLEDVTSVSATVRLEDTSCAIGQTKVGVFKSDEQQNSQCSCWEGETTLNISDCLVVITELCPNSEYIIDIGDDTGINCSVSVKTAPAAPSGFENGAALAISHNEIKVTWKEPNCSNADSLKYKIYDRKSHKVLTETEKTEAIVSALEPKTEYDFVIQACGNNNKTLCVNFSNVSAKTEPTKPSQPENFRVENITSNSVILRWEEPKDKGGSSVDGYKWSWKKLDGQQEGINFTSDTFAIVKELQLDTEYLFTVLAYNVMNNGSHLEGDTISTNATTDPKSPSAPEKFVVRALNSSTIVLSWDHPADSQGRVAGFHFVCQHVESGEDVANITLPASQNEIVVTDLQPWSNYSCQIWAFNVRHRDGELIYGNYSEGDTTTLPSASSQPLDFLAKNVTFSSVTLTWNKPEFPRGPIEGFVVTWCKGHGNKCMNSSTANLFFLVDRLEPWTEYTFNVAAFHTWDSENITGDEAVKTEKTQPWYPGSPPEEFSVVVLSAVAMNLTWKEPIVKNGPIDGYVLCVKINNDNCTPSELIAGSQREFLLERLEPYTVHNLSLCAYNNDQYDGPLIGPCSELANRTFPAAPSEVPSLVVAEVGARGVVLAWEKPRIPNGPISGYFLKWGPIGSEEMDNVTVSAKIEKKTITQTLNGLVPYTNYSFQVAAYNYGMQKDGELLVGSYFQIFRQTMITAPSSPHTLLLEDVGSYSARVTWKSPLELNGELDGYRLTLCLNDREMNSLVCQANNVTKTSNTSLLNDLKPWRNYTLSVSAFNNPHHWSQETTLSFKTKAGIPAYPLTNLTSLQAKESQIEFAFPMDLFLDFQGPITSYSIIVLMVDPKNMTSKRMNGTRTEALDSWSMAKVNNFKTPYQASPEKWNPYVYDTSDPMQCDNHTSKEFNGRKCIIGTQTDCENQDGKYCNGPLNSGSYYTVTIRGFTDEGWSDTYPLEVFVESTQSFSDTLGVAVGVSMTVIFLLIATLVATFIVRKKGLWPPKKSESAPYVPKREDATSMNNMPPKRSVIIKVEEFADHVTAMLSDSGLKFSEEFEALCAASPKHPSTVAESTGNKSKNRWANILPFDHSRVKLLPIQDDQETDYINASYIPGNSSRREYVATQGPLPATKDDFWRMIWEQNVSMVVMLTLCMERGKAKCEQYWRDDWEPHYHADCLKVVKISESVLSAYTIRIFDIQMGGQQRSVKHMHFTKWPDFGCPENPEILINFVRAVRDHLPHSRPGPILVHCSAGVGRTGTFIAVDRLMQQIRDKGEHLDIYRMVMEMRDHRCSMVQTEDQYIYIHECVREIIREESERSHTPVPDGYEIYSNLNYKETENVT